MPEVTATIAESASLSAGVLLNGAEMVGLKMPADWTTAALTFQVSTDGVTYNNLYDQDGSEVNVSVGAARYIALPPADYAGFIYLKVRSGTSATPVVQAAERSIGIMVEDL